MVIPTRTKINLGFGLALTLLGVISVFTYRESLRSMQAARWVNHTHETLEQLATTLSLVVEAEAARRGYVLTGDTSFLDRYDTIPARLDTSLRRLHELTSDEPNGQERLRQLEPLIRRKLESLQASIQLRKEKGATTAEQEMFTQQGKVLTDQIRRLTEEMQQQQRTLLTERTAKSQASAWTTIGIAAVGCSLALFVILVSLLMFDIALSKRQRAEEEISDLREIFDITERKRAEAEMAERHRLATLVADMGVALTGAESLRQGLQQCTEILVRDLDAALARIWTVHEEDKVLDLQASAGIYTHLDGGHARVPIGKLEIGRIAESGEPHLTNTVLEDSWVGDPEWARREGMVAFAGYPLKVGEHVLGVVAAFARQPLTPATLQAFASVAHSLAQFIKRKRAEETLRESEEKYRALIETTGTGYVIMDTQGRVVDANAEYVWLAGHRALQEILGRRVTEWTAPHDRARNAEAVRRCAELGFVRDLEIEYVDGEGKCTPVEVDATIVPAAGGVRIVGLCRDISERKRVQQALQESEERYRDLAENAAELIQSVSQEGQFLYVNRAWRETLGYSMEEVTRIKLGNVIAPELLPQCQEVFAKVRRGEAANDVETVFVAKTGKRVAVRGSVSCRLVDGKHDVTNGIFRDITARLEIEKMKDEFVSTVSHELRTPLTSIRGALGLLTAGVLNAEPAKARRMLEIAVANTDRLIRLINDILDIERIESGRVKLEKRSCPTASLMVQAMNSVREVADRAGVKLELFPISTSVLADPDRVVQALTNLLGNAIKFSPSSSTVTLRATPQQSEMLFEVKDQGRGIPADKLGVIFERFQQVDASDGREKGGTGLGLAICRSIVDQHGGRIWAESELGKGSSFYFTLPLLKEEEFLQQNLKTE
jgi:PAS domain S-box-containing protein